MMGSGAGGHFARLYRSRHGRDRRGTRRDHRAARRIARPGQDHRRGDGGKRRLGGAHKALATSLGSDYGRASTVSPPPWRTPGAGVYRRGGADGVVACILPRFDESTRLLLLIEERFRGPESLDSSQAAQFAALAVEALEMLGSAARAGEDVAAQASAALAARFVQSFQAPAVAISRSRRSNNGCGRKCSPLCRASKGATRASARSRAGGPMKSFSNSKAIRDGRRHHCVAFDLGRDDYQPHGARDGVNCFEFLILSDHAVEWVSGQLAALDPERLCLRGITDLNRGSRDGGERAYRRAIRARAAHPRPQRDDRRTHGRDRRHAQPLRATRRYFAAGPHRQGGRSRAPHWAHAIAAIRNSKTSSTRWKRIFAS